MTNKNVFICKRKYVLQTKDLTWFSETIGSKLFHRTEDGTELLSLLSITKGVDHPGTHAAKREEHHKLTGD